jgi:uncharacterized protein (DUF2147 family)
MQKQFKTTLCVTFILLVFISANAQTGLNFQGVARTSNNVILASQQISLRLSILQGSATGNTEYLEVRKVTTNPQGLFTAVIGDADATSTVGLFSSINWKNTPKYLKIEMDPTAGNNFTTMGTTQFQYVAYAQYASSVDAENIIGMIPISKGGTGVSSIAGLKTALAIDKTSMGLSNVDNTTDLLKPVSTATQTAFDAKANTSDVTTSLLLKENTSNKSSATDLGGNSPSDILFPTQKAVKQYVLANVASGGIADGGITTIKLADGAITDMKINSVSGSKILGNILGNAATVTTNANLTGVVTSLGNTTSIANGAITNAMLSNTAVANLTGINSGDETEASIKSKLGVANFFSGTYSDLTGKPSLFGGSYNDLSNKPDLTLKENSNNKSINFITDAASDIKFPTVKAVKGYVDAIFLGKQDALTNPVTGTGTSGQLSFFNGTTTLTSSSNLMWDATHHRLGIGTTLPGYPVEINTGASNYGLMISSESSNSWGSGIGFKSSTDAVEKTGLFQLDRDGAMVFRTLQDNMYFDNAGSGSINFRMGDPNVSNIGMTLNNSGNLEVTGTLKTGTVVYPNVSGTLGDVLTADASGNPIWQASTGNGSSSNVDAGTLSGTILNSTITTSSLTSVGTLTNLSVTNPINGSVTGNAATVTTNANLTGVVTSVGNVTSIGNSAISNSMLANTAVINLSGVNTGDNAVNTRYNSLITDVANLLLANTGDNAVNTRYNSLVTNAAHYGDIRAMITGSDGYYVIGINGTRLLDLPTGILKNTTGTGVPSIAVASDFPTLNQSTTGNAATSTKLSTSKNINGVAFDGTSDITIAADAGTLSGNTLKSSVINSSLTSVGTLANLTVTNTINGSINGNAASASTATKLTNSRNINGVTFDGTSNITVAASAGTLTGTTLNATVTGSSLTSVGVLNNATVNGKVIVGASSETSASAILEASSTTQGFLPPRMTIAQRVTIVNPVQGLMIYCTNCGTYGEPQYYNGNSWMNFAGTATSKGTPTITILVGTYTYTSAAQGPTSATNTGTGSTYSFTYVGTGSTTYASSSTKPTNAGTYSVTVSLSASGDGNYNAASASAAFTIAQAIPTVTPTVGTYAYSGSAQGPTAATNTGTGTSYTFSYTGTGITSYGPSATKPTDGGTYTVIATVAANGNYAASSSSATAFSISISLAVGNTYGGGKVAYILTAGDIGYDANQQHGLIISGDLTNLDMNWGIKNEVTGATGGVPIDGIYPPADLETGMSNTNIIINSEGSGTNYAAGLARAYTGGGYTNWYLPSASQMQAMKSKLSPFTKVHYWTSTENDYLAAYALFATGGNPIESFDKINTQFGVRAARSF